jgi:hypothetical protein
VSKGRDISCPLLILVVSPNQDGFKVKGCLLRANPLPLVILSVAKNLVPRASSCLLLNIEIGDGSKIFSPVELATS